MISVEEAISLAVDAFPNGPEQIVERLGITVRYADMDGCDGWCIASPERALIRVNSKLPSAARRFTLAHELSHILLGTPAVVGESYGDMLSSNNAEERRVNSLAGDLLLPSEVVISTLQTPPIVAAALTALAKKGNVSELATAVRVCNIADRVGLQNASVISFDDGTVRWQWSKTLRMDNETAKRLLVRTRTEQNSVARIERDADVIVASTIENRYFGSAILFVQLLSKELGLALSPHERRKQLEQQLLTDNKFQQRVSGLMGAHKPRTTGMTLDGAVQLFWERNQQKLAGTPLDSELGREYVEIRIRDWV